MNSPDKVIFLQQNLNLIAAQEKKKNVQPALRDEQIPRVKHMCTLLNIAQFLSICTVDTALHTASRRKYSPSHNEQPLCTSRKERKATDREESVTCGMKWVTHSAFSLERQTTLTAQSLWKPFKRNGTTEFSGILDHIHQILNAAHYHMMNVNTHLH